MKSIWMMLPLIALPLGARSQEKPADPPPPPVQQGAETSGETVTPTSFDKDLRDLPPVPAWKPGDPVKEIPRLRTRPANAPMNADPVGEDPLLAAQAAAAPPQIEALNPTILSFNGQGYTGVNPPDTCGDVGTNYYIQAINGGGGSLFTVHNKTTGAVVSGPTAMETLGSGACASGAGDPVVLWDPLANRWVLTEFAGTGNHLCVYVSKTSDPVSGGWWAYDYTTPTFPDYPKYAVWPDAYYVGTNESSSTLYALDRASMLSGAAARPFQRFTVADLSGFTFQMVTPADLDGATAPPANAPAVFLRHRDGAAHGGSDSLELFTFALDWNTPANSAVTGPISIPVAAFDSTLCGLTSFNCIPQPGTGTTLDPLREVTMWRNQYRNFGGYESIVGNFSVDVGSDRAGVRWFELRKVGAGAWTLYQEGTYSPGTDSRWMGSAAQDASGNLAVAYNLGSGSTYPSLKYVGRMSNAPLGTLPETEQTIVSGTASNGSNRYGDYAALTVDPSDDYTFWFTGEWNGASSWSTRIAKFAFDQDPDFTIDVTPATRSVCAPAGTTYTVTIGQLVGFTGAVTLSTSGVPAGATASFTTNPVTTPGSTTLTISNTGAATPGTYTITVTGTSGALTHNDTVQIVIAAVTPLQATLTAPANGASGQSATATLTWGALSTAASYDVQIATDANFTSIVQTGTPSAASYAVSPALLDNTLYHWRVRGVNGCGNGPWSSPFAFRTAPPAGSGCSAGYTAATVYAYGFESGASGWTSSGTGNTWALSGARVHAGANSYLGVDSAAVSDQRLVSPSIALPSGQNPLTLSFWNYQAMEANGASACYDGGILEISTNGGGAWTQVTAGLATDPYNGPVSASYSNPLMNLNAWCGDPQNWLDSKVSLDSYAGQNVMFRWRLGSDSSVAREGWYIDDVSVTSCVPSGGGAPPPVPDGGPVPGTPLNITKGAADGSTLGVTWDTTTCTATDYNLYWGYGGDLPVGGGNFTVRGAVVGLGTNGASGLTWNGAPTPDASNWLWMLVVGTNGVNTEGSWGAMTGSVERTGPGTGGASNVGAFTAKDVSDTTCN